MTENNIVLPKIKIAFILDGQVVDILHTHDRLAAILLSEPLIVDITEVKSDANSEILPGYTYNATANTFTPPVVGA
jgi:hypothetical protein